MNWFASKRWVKDWVYDYMRDHRNVYHKDITPICDDCGCLLGRSVWGTEEIRERQQYAAIGFIAEKYIHTPRYCGRCAKDRGLK